MRVLLSGGGTAGHIYPALAVAERLLAEHDHVRFVGTPDGLEARLAREAGIEFMALPSRGFDRARPWTLVSAVAVALASTFRALGLIARERPDVVVCFGAYVTVPLGLAALVKRVPLVLHEQNSVPGMANKLLSKWAHRVGVTYEDSAAHLAHPGRARVTGNPVRGSVLGADRASGRATLGIEPDETVLLVFGGSRGARHLNQAVIGMLGTLGARGRLRVILVTGPAEYARVGEALRSANVPGHVRVDLHDYLPRMGEALAAADLVICRAGATTLAEITALGVPAVVVPYPYATDDHQTANALTLVDHGAVRMVADADLDADSFPGLIASLLADERARATMSAASRALAHADAAQALVELVRSAAAAHDRDTHA